MQSWDTEIGSNCKNIAIEFAKDNRVLYVNYPLDRITVIRSHKDPKVQKRLSIIKNQRPDLEEIQSNLWNLNPKVILESITWLPSGIIYDKLNYHNNKKFANKIQKAADQLGFKNFILFNDNLVEKGLYLKELLKPESAIYYLRDNLNFIPFHQKHGQKAEKELISKVDVVTANSDFLADYARKFNPHSYMVGQGCDIDLFQDVSIKVASEMETIPKPVIGYIGALTANRLDIPLIVGIGQELPHVSLILIGPEDEAFQQSILHQMKNVHFLGKKLPELLPSYLKGFDIALNPQLINEVTVGNYPRKVDEYLAMGKPTVTTNTPFMAYFKDHVYLANDLEEYIKMISKALEENNPESEQKRRAFASEHTWQNSVQTIGKCLNLAKESNRNS